MNIIQGDNLNTLRVLVAAGEKFDLIELDGPYGAGLEAWDALDEDAYLAHYAERLPLVAQLLQPWGVSFLFGYPEGCAEIKAWARQGGELRLLRWITWYKQRTANMNRKCETILVLAPHDPTPATLANFGSMLRERRIAKGWSLRVLGERAGEAWWHRGGNLYYETGRGGIPTREQMTALSALLEFNAAEWDYLYEWGKFLRQTFVGVTDIDYISRTYPEDSATLAYCGGGNNSWLRSKPVGLYLDLFRPVVPPRDTKRALILYGGSGNAGIAAGRLGYDVTFCEQEAARCELIRRRWAWHVERRDETPEDEYGPLFAYDAA